MTDPLVTPVQAAPVRAIDRRHWLLAGIIAILGGYLTILAIGGNLIQQLLGFSGAPAEFTLLFVGQLVFAVAVAVLGYFLAPGPLGRRVLASAIYVVAVAVLVVCLTLRLGGGAGPVLGGPFIGATLTNSFFMILLFGALAWLIAARARPIAYLALLLVAAIAPIGTLFALGGISNAVSSMVQLVAVGVAAVVILLVSIPRASSVDEPIDTADLPS
jgi:hypothetical protein